MYDAACHRDDVIAAYEELRRRFVARRASLWEAYLDATRSLPHRYYAEEEHECWSVLQAGLAGIAAEERVVQRDFESRLASIEDARRLAG